MQFKYTSISYIIALPPIKIFLDSGPLSSDSNSEIKIATPRFRICEKRNQFFSNFHYAILFLADLTKCHLQRGFCVYTPILMEVDTPLGSVDTGDVEADSEVGCPQDSCSFETLNCASVCTLYRTISYPYLILFRDFRLFKKLGQVRSGAKIISPALAQDQVLRYFRHAASRNLSSKKIGTRSIVDPYWLQFESVSGSRNLMAIVKFYSKKKTYFLYLFILFPSTRYRFSKVGTVNF
jgi:hypothetical protein